MYPLSRRAAKPTAITEIPAAANRIRLYRFGESRRSKLTAPAASKSPGPFHTHVDQRLGRAFIAGRNCRVEEFVSRAVNRPPNYSLHPPNSAQKVETRE